MVATSHNYNSNNRSPSTSNLAKNIFQICTVIKQAQSNSIKFVSSKMICLSHLLKLYLNPKQQIYNSAQKLLTVV